MIYQDFTSKHKNKYCKYLIPVRSCSDNGLDSLGCECNSLKKYYFAWINTNQSLPSGGSENSALALISHTKLFNCQQSLFLKYPSFADCWIQVEEPNNKPMYCLIMYGKSKISKWKYIKIWQNISLRSYSRHIL